MIDYGLDTLVMDLFPTLRSPNPVVSIPVREDLIRILLDGKRWA